MAMRKTSSAHPDKTEPRPKPPYVALRTTLKVQADGSLRLPVSWARLLADTREDVIVTLLSDGSVKLERTPVDQEQHPLSPELREALDDAREGRGTFYRTSEDFLAALRARSD